MNVLVFDIETVPDVATGRLLHDLDDVDDAQVAEAMFILRRKKTGSDFLALHLHRVVAISAVYRSFANDRLTIWSLASVDSDEAEIIQNFFDGIDKHTPTLVSWNGSGFDLPVLHYRSLLHKIRAPRYWELGEDDSSFKWNNYINRFHQRHTDLMDMVAAYNNRAFAPLDDIALMLGLPGKMGMSGANVWPQYQAGELKAIRDYCETDALNTYLIYLRFQLTRGVLSEKTFDAEIERVRSYLAASEEAHFKQYLEQWS